MNNSIICLKNLSLKEKIASKNCILKKRKLTNLVHFKYRFKILIKLIINKCY